MEKKASKGPRVPPELFVKSKIREYVKSKGSSTSGDLLNGDRLNDLIVDILDKAIERAKANGRKTVKKRDF